MELHDELTTPPQPDCPDCRNHPFARGMCRADYMRWYKTVRQDVYRRTRPLHPRQATAYSGHKPGYYWHVLIVPAQEAA